MAGIEWPGYSRLDADFAAIVDYDATPLMFDWCQHLVEGNRRGVLSGLDGNNNPMPPLKYRGGAGKKTRNRRVPDYGTTLHAPGGDALNSAEYRLLTGPRLAPRREQSHAIADLFTEVRAFPAERRWEAVAAWGPFTTDDGRSILEFHFEGMGHNPKYDLRPVRPEDLKFCENALKAFLKEQFFRSY